MLIIVSINGFSYKMPDSTNINNVVFTIISVHKLNNTYYPYWKTLVTSYLKLQDL